MGHSSGVSPRLRLALVGVGDTAVPGYFSGIPARLADGLVELGVDVVHVNCEVPRPTRAAMVGTALIAQSAGTILSKRPARGITAMPVLAITSSAIARSRLHCTSRLDGVVQFSSELLLSPGVALATFEDMTVAQAGRLYP